MISRWLDRMLKRHYTRHMAKTWPKRVEAARRSTPR